MLAHTCPQLGLSSSAVLIWIRGAFGFACGLGPLGLSWGSSKACLFLLKTVGIGTGFLEFVTDSEILDWFVLRPWVAHFGHSVC